jgi:hypothetical protein
MECRRRFDWESGIPNALGLDVYHLGLTHLKTTIGQCCTGFNASEGVDSGPGASRAGRWDYPTRFLLLFCVDADRTAC